MRFFVFFNKKKTAQVAWFNSHKKGKEPHPDLLHCRIFEAQPTSRPRRRRMGAGAIDESPHATGRHTHRHHCRREPALRSTSPFHDAGNARARAVGARAAMCSRRTDDGGGAGRSGKGGCCRWSRQGNTLSSRGSARPFPRLSVPLSGDAAMRLTHISHHQPMTYIAPMTRDCAQRTPAAGEAAADRSANGGDDEPTGDHTHGST